MKKKKSSTGGIIYSTNPQFNFENEEELQELPNHEQQIKIRLDKKQRAGKIVTLVTGFELLPENLSYLGKELKSICGTGGSAKNNEIIIQGDHRNKVFQYLQKQGFTKSKIS